MENFLHYRDDVRAIGLGGVGPQLRNGTVCHLIYDPAAQRFERLFLLRREGSVLAPYFFYLARPDLFQLRLQAGKPEGAHVIAAIRKAFHLQD